MKQKVFFAQFRRSRALTARRSLLPLTAVKNCSDTLQLYENDPDEANENEFRVAKYSEYSERCYYFTLHNMHLGTISYKKSADIVRNYCRLFLLQMGILQKFIMLMKCKTRPWKTLARNETFYGQQQKKKLVNWTVMKFAPLQSAGSVSTQLQGATGCCGTWTLHLNGDKSGAKFRTLQEEVPNVKPGDKNQRVVKGSQFSPRHESCRRLRLSSSPHPLSPRAWSVFMNKPEPVFKKCFSIKKSGKNRI